ncbi:hypothetical protein [Chromobacterium vaccinii]|uniref:hypothetical protein n=1 Tax=Chromobacterium vaccinii TaxID=1108595 RepID=UPI0034580365
MEDKAIYSVPGTAGVRPETLLPFSNGWQAPSGDEVRYMLLQVGIAQNKGSALTGKETGELVGVLGRQVRRWLSGDSEIPFAAWAILCAEAGIGHIWKADLVPSETDRLPYGAE